jgi:hypothetical protein
MKPQYRAALSTLATARWSAKSASDHGLSPRVLADMEVMGLAERVGDRWIATPVGQRAHRTGRTDR